MADTFSSAILGLGVDTKQFNKDIDNTGASVEKALERMKLSADAFSDKWGDMTAGIKDTKRIVSGILVSQGFYALSNTLLNAGAAALSFSQNMETAAISMEYFVTGADKVAKAQAYLRSMNTFAAKTPFSTEEALSLSKYMQAVGVSMGTTKSFLSVITDTAAATGATNENLQRIVFGLGQMMTKGRLANEEIRQLANANIPIYEILQEQLGLTGKQISNIGSYWIDADKAVVAILNGLETRYAGAADRISNTMTGMLDTLKDDAKIITQIAGAGMYDTIASTMTGLRDTLDRYREIATEKGSMGLFDQILRDMDASGELGTQILALIGNTRQLGEAFRELYISGRPVIDLIGKSLYASITVAEVTLTSFAQVANSVVGGLDKLGLTSGTTAEVLASLFIAYKAAKWMAFLGQGAAAAAYGMYQSVTAASAMLPASLRASAGVKLLTTGLIGLITYGLTAFGIFKMLNNSFAGLDTKTSAGNLFPDDYSAALKKYQEEMDAYNKKIASYQDDYNTPYTEISDGADSAKSSLEDVADTSKKTAASVKNDWTAAFDEVYSIPDQTYGAADAAALKDLGELLQSPAFTFPDLSGLGDELKAPEFPWSDVFKGGLLDSDVLNGDWWKTLLPMVLMGAAGFLGDTLAKNMGKNGPSGKDGGGSSADSSPFQSAKDAAGVLKNLSKDFTKVEQGVKDIGEKLKEGKFASVEEQQGLYKLLEERLAAANKLLDKINRQAIIAGKFDSYLESSVLKEFNNLSEVHKIADNVNRLSTLAEQAKETGLLGDGARKEISEIKKLLEKQYASYVGRNGASTTELDTLLKGIINTKGLEGLVSTLLADTAELCKLAKESNFNLSDLAERIDATARLGNSILKELTDIEADTSAISEPVSQINELNKLLKLQISSANKTAELLRLREILSAKDAAGLSGSEVSATEDRISTLEKSIQSLNKSIDAQTVLISNGSEADLITLQARQLVIQANNTFANTLHGTLGNYLSAVIRPLAVLERYGQQVVLGQIEGQNIVKAGIKSTTTLIAQLNKDYNNGLRTVFEDLRTQYEQMIKTGTLTQGTLEGFTNKLLATLQEMGHSLGTEQAVIELYSAQLVDGLKKISGKSAEIEYLLRTSNKVVRPGGSLAGRTGDALPPVLYHVTSETLLEEILKEGLKADAFVTVADETAAGLQRIATASTAFVTAAGDVKDGFVLLKINTSRLLAGTTLLADQLDKPVPVSAIENMGDLKTLIPTVRHIRDILDVLDDRLSILIDETKTVAEFDKGIKGIYKFLEESFPEETAALRAEIAEQITVSRELLAEKLESLKGLQKLANSSLYRISSRSESTRFLQRLISEVAGLNKTMVGTGIRKGWADPAAYASEILKQAGIFDPARTALSGGDMAGMFGQSGYGVNVFSAIISNMSGSTRELAGISAQLQTLQSRANMTFGSVGEIPILAEAAKVLAEKGITLTLGDTFFNEQRTIQAQLDALLWNKGRFTAPIDAKALSSFSGKFKPLLETVAHYSDGIYKINAAGFKHLIAATDDVAWQLAVQATVMGKNAAWLAVLDTKGAGIAGPDLSTIMMLDPTVSGDIKKIEQLMEKQAAQQYAARLDAIKDNLYLVRVSIPKWAKETVEQMGVAFRAYQDALSEAVLSGGNIKELITPLNMLGEKIGVLTEQRYISADFKAPSTGNAGLNSILIRIEEQLKNSSTAIQDIGATRLEEVAERLEAAAYNNTSILETRLIDLGYTASGSKVIVKATGQQLVDEIIPAIKNFQSSFEGYASTLVTQFSDMVKQLNTAAEANKQLTDVIRTNAAGQSFTVKDLAFQIMDTAKKVPGGTDVSAALQSMLSGNVAMPISSNAGFADLSTALAALNSAKTISGIADDLSSNTGLSANAFVPTYMFEQLVSTLSMQDFYAQLYDTLTVQEKLATEAAQKTLQAVQMPDASQTTFMGSNTAALPGSIYSDIFGRNLGIVTDGLEKMPEAFAEKVVKPLQQYIEVHNAQQSNGLIDLFSGGLIQKLTEYYAKSQPLENQKGMLGSKLYDNSELLYGYGFSSALETLVRYNKDQSSDTGTISPVTSSRALDYEDKYFGSLAGARYQAWVSNFLHEFESTTDKITELNRIAANPYSSDFEYLSYLTIYANSEKDTAKRDEIAEYINASDLYEVLGLASLDSLKPVVELLQQQDTSLPDLTMQNQAQYSAIIQQLQDGIEAQLLPTLQAQQQYNSLSDSPLSGDYSRIIAGADFSTLSEQAATQLNDVLGISLENLSNGLGKISIDSEAIMDNIVGWTTRLPSTISLDGSTISTQDAKILAQAGIQINGDGTITFMKALNENTTGTERNTTLTISDVSDDVITKLNKSGLSFDLSGTVAKLDLSLATVSKNMQSAMYKLNTDLTGQVSDTAKTALSGLGTVLDSGYFQITNQAVLNGSMTISEYIASMGATAKLVQPEILTALEGIDGVIAQGGEATRQTVAEWADGIVMPSPIKAADINDEMTAAFAAIGITFETQGNEFMMVVNRVGNQLSDGMTLIPQATWDKLNDGIKDALQKLGVSMVTEAGYVKVDISDAMCKIITPEDITPSLQTAMGELGLAFKAEGDKVTLISSTTGENIANGMYTLPTAIYDKLSPDTIAALEALHVGIVTKGTETMLNFKNVMEGGVGDVIELFANRPDLWDQIPKIVVDKLAEAGISVKNGMIDISTQELNGLVNIDTQWYGYWSTMPQDVIDAMGAAKLQTSDGLMQIEKITESTKIPADINTYIKKPFDELPAEIQDRLTGGDDSVKKSLQGSEVLITGATKDAFVGAVQAVHDNFTNMNTEADAGAQQLANTISNALASVQKLSNIKVGASWRPFEDTTKAAISGSPGNYTVRYGSNKYSGIMAQSEKEAVKMVERLTGIDIPGYAAGGIISTDGLYRAGEFGAKEGIIPLENQSALKLVGSAIAGQMPSNSSGTMYLGGIDSTALKSLYSAFESFPRINAEAIRGAVVALTAQQEKLPEKPLSLITSIQGTLVNLSDFNKTTFADLPMSLADIKTAIDSASSAIQSSTANISVSSSFGSTLGSTASADYSGVMAPVEERLGVDMSWDDVVDYVNNKAQYANADDATKLSLQAANQAIRDAYSINEDVFSYDDLMGSASGSLVTKDALYRAGEFGLNEAIIPIERPDVMSKIGQAIVNSMPVEFTELLKSAVGMKNAGVVTPTTTINYQPTQDTASIVEAITQKVLENVLPAMGGTNQEVPTPIYVGTLIADDAGLRELNKKMRIVELRETARRS